MQDFRTLRREAKAIRNDAIASAREQYDRTLAIISHLEASSNGHTRRASRGMMAQAISPGEFSVGDLLASLERMHPEKKWERQHVRQFLSRSCCAGVLRRVSPGIYVRIEAPRQPTLVDAVASVLDRPMTVTEIYVTLLERGYKTKSTSRNFREKVFKVMRKEPSQFKKKGDKWDASSLGGKDDKVWE